MRQVFIIHEETGLESIYNLLGHMTSDLGRTEFEFEAN